MTNDDKHQPNWKPLELRLGSKAYALGDWMWMFRDHGLEHYKHIATRKYLTLDAQGKAYRAQHGGAWTEIDFGYALAQATGRMTLAEHVKALADALGIQNQPDFSKLTETTLGYMLVSMRHIEQERRDAK